MSNNINYLSGSDLIFSARSGLANQKPFSSPEESDVWCTFSKATKSGSLPGVSSSFQHRWQACYQGRVCHHKAPQANAEPRNIELRRKMERNLVSLTQYEHKLNFCSLSSKQLSTSRAKNVHFLFRYKLRRNMDWSAFPSTCLWPKWNDISLPQVCFSIRLSILVLTLSAVAYRSGSAVLSNEDKILAQVTFWLQEVAGHRTTNLSTYKNPKSFSTSFISWFLLNP